MERLIDRAAAYHRKCKGCGFPILTGVQGRITDGTGDYHAECFWAKCGASHGESPAHQEDAIAASHYGPSQPGFGAHERRADPDAS